ncbi:hypothetical protein CEXT_541381 [Caerostris extrusa]|uniref:Ribosomal protein L16 n=1 Tax=Caerostris extrusa TaxID=172846 RepID=A0AAV4XFJ1_CAEEX|nr:hypothetical protein CEXT_541381 [Caerostris extrusa]
MISDRYFRNKWAGMGVLRGESVPICSSDNTHLLRAARRKRPRKLLSEGTGHLPQGSKVPIEIKGAIFFRVYLRSDDIKTVEPFMTAVRVLTCLGCKFRKVGTLDKKKLD